MKKPLRALLIEDSEFDAALLANLLKAGGYDVQWQRVETADEMRAALAARDWDIILSDHQMPRFSAPEALEILKGTARDLPFIIVSGGIGEAVAVALMKAGAHDFVMKGQLGRMVPAVERELREAANRGARRQAERSLQESEMRYRLLWENSPDAIILMDAEGGIAFVNPAVQQVFGYPAEALIGQPLDRLFERCGEVPPALRSRPWLASDDAGRPPMIEVTGCHQAGREVIVEIGFSRMEMSGQYWYVAFVRDITERRQAEQALRQKQEEYRVARQIQQRLFPKAAPQLEGYDIAGASFPADEAGGDYYDYLPMMNDGLGLAIGDVSGHGIGPAMIMAATRAYLRIVGLNREAPSEVMTRANRALAEDLSGSDRFVTALLVRLDPVSRRFVYVNAGHPGGYLLDIHGNLKLRLVRNGRPLGMFPDAEYVDAPAIHLAPGDLVALVTDGLEEAVGPSGDCLGPDRLFEIIRSQRNRPAAEIVAELHRAVRVFAAGTPQEDDVTAVVIKVLA